ncbi:Glucose-1-phosphate thymidylyltransferase [hydrothermal vent metagenome]|uniref:glucose-1-phosphate thymidylyltransferase n=1 Tax=hydrothermal vent metagenome TaxID=652676 RepID=A0A3B0ZKZ4_9ZZZZ
MQEANVIGLIPAAGKATRLAPLPCSKEILPIGYDELQSKGKHSPKVAIQYLIDAMLAAGISEQHIVLRQGKWDVPSYLENLTESSAQFAYHVLRDSLSSVHSLDKAYPFIRDKVVALGFPDILLGCVPVYQPILNELKTTKADIVLALFPAEQPDLVDMVELDKENNVLAIEIKPNKTALSQTWGAAVWQNSFTEFIHDCVGNADFGENAVGREPHIGDVIGVAIAHGFSIKAVKVSDVPYLDIGTPSNLVAAVRANRRQADFRNGN